MWSTHSITCVFLTQPCGWNTRLNTPCLITVASMAAFQSRIVTGLFVPWRCCASQSLGTMHGISQIRLPMAYG